MKPFKDSPDFNKFESPTTTHIQSVNSNGRKYSKKNTPTLYICPFHPTQINPFFVFSLLAPHLVSPSPFPPTQVRENERVRESNQASWPKGISFTFLSPFYMTLVLYNFVKYNTNWMCDM
jgi:hypothetical protein